MVDLRVVPQVCTETSPNVMWKLVRALLTVKLVRKADCPLIERLSLRPY